MESKKPGGHPQTEETRKKISRTLRGDHRGRPTVDTPEMRQKIEEAAAYDCSVAEIALYAGISRETFYQIIKKDKRFSDRIEQLRQNPILKARKTVVGALNDPYHAQWYLERKRKDEYSMKTVIEDETSKQQIDALRKDLSGLLGKK